MNTPLRPESFQIGAIPAGDRTFFRVWAPSRTSLHVEIEREGHWQRFPMERDAAGYFTTTLNGVRAGDRYQYRLDSRTTRPDPVSRFQPDGVHHASQVVDSESYVWHDHSWRGIAKQDLIIYEFHVGTLTQEGTFRAAIACIPEWQSLGITAVELLPVAQTPGRWNWGYDGVNLFAVRNSYGTADDLKSLIDACHQAGIAVILDVVYNHLGPEGNYLADFGHYFSQKHHTPWGNAFNYDGRHSGPVRDYILANAWQWLVEFHFDGLRLDAAHFMYDEGQPHILQSLRESVDHWQSQLHRPLYLIAETNVYDRQALQPTSQSGWGLDAVWCDDLMHSLLSIPPDAPRLTHREYCGHRDVAKFLRCGHLYEYRPDQGHPGYVRAPECNEAIDLNSLVVGIQTHDSVGNHPLGRRIHHLANREFQQASAACMLLYPTLPLLFMGEEFATAAPFLFFVDFHDERLRQAIAKNRRLEYPDHNWDEALSPIDEQAFWACIRGQRENEDLGMWHWYQELLQLRKSWRAAGMLDRLNLAANDWPEHQLFVWTYKVQGQPSTYVAVRLGPNYDAPAIGLNLESPPLLHSGDPRFDQRPRLSQDPGARYTLGMNQAVIGVGSFSLDGNA